MRKLTAPILGAALLAAGCSGDALRPGDATLSEQEVAMLAPAFEEVSAAAIDPHVLGVFAVMPAPGAEGRGELEFSRTRDCPGGGEVRVAGTITREVDRPARTIVTRTRATLTHVACVLPRRQQATLTLNGDPHIAIAADRRVVEGALSGLQTMTHQGAFTWARSTGESGRCTVDLRTTFDPATRTMTQQGEICGRAVDRSATGR